MLCNCLTVWTNWKLSFFYSWSTDKSQHRDQQVQKIQLDLLLEVLINHLWLFLGYPLARLRTVHSDMRQPWCHEDKTGQSQCQCVDSRFMDEVPNYLSLHSPLLHPVWDTAISLRSGIKFNATSPASTPTLLPTNKTKLIRPARFLSSVS